MPTELLISAGPGEWRAAWVEDGTAIELHVERGDAAPAGSIRLGRVVRLVGGLDAALVDIGEERPGFLPIRSRKPDEGSQIVVEVRREARRGKGALLSDRIAPDTQARLADLAVSQTPPAPLDPQPGFASSLARRLPGAPESVSIDSTAPLPELRAAFPDAEIAHRAVDEWPLDLDAVFEAALAPTVGLPGGGRLYIEEAAAAVLIDVDTGSPEGGTVERTAMAANLAAAREIARQLRLRQLGGGIVVDFAALEGSRPRERVRQAAAAALAGDPMRPHVLGWTRLGHLELVRPRRGRSLGDAMLQPGEWHKSDTALAFEALRRLWREARANPAANWRIVAGPGVAAALRGPAAEALRGIEIRLGRTVAIVAVPASRGADPFDIEPL